MEDGLEYEDYDGQIKKSPFDIDPEVLFEWAELMKAMTGFSNGGRK